MKMAYKFRDGTPPNNNKNNNNNNNNNTTIVKLYNSIYTTTFVTTIVRIIDCMYYNYNYNYSILQPKPFSATITRNKLAILFAYFTLRPFDIYHASRTLRNIP